MEDNDETLCDLDEASGFPAVYILFVLGSIYRTINALLALWPGTLGSVEEIFVGRLVTLSAKREDSGWLISESNHTPGLRVSLILQHNAGTRNSGVGNTAYMLRGAHITRQISTLCSVLTSHVPDPRSGVLIRCKILGYCRKD